MSAPSPPQFAALTRLHFEKTLKAMQSPVSSPLQRIGPLARLPAVLMPYGVTVAAVLEGLPLTEADLRPEVSLPIPVISAVLDRASALTGGAPVGLLIARGQNHLALGPLGQLMACCDTLGSALGTFVSFQMTNSTAAAAWLLPLEEDYALGFGVYAAGIASSHLYDASLAVGANMLQDLTAGAVSPVEVLLSRPEPVDPATLPSALPLPAALR